MNSKRVYVERYVALPHGAAPDSPDRGPCHSYVLVDAAQHPEDARRLIEQVQAQEWATVYMPPVQEDDAWSPPLFLAQTDTTSSQWRAALYTLHQHEPCFIHVRSRLEMEALADHLRAYLFAELELGLRYMVRYFDPRNLAAVLDIWPPAIRHAFLAPLVDLQFRTHQDVWQQITGRDEEPSFFIPRIVLTVEQEDRLIAHADLAGLIHDLGQGGYIDARQPYAQRHRQVENYMHKAHEWGMTDIRDVKLYCQYCCCNGDEFDQVPEVNATFQSLRAPGSALSELCLRIPLNAPPFPCA